MKPKRNQQETLSLYTLTIPSSFGKIFKKKRERGNKENWKSFRITLSRTKYFYGGVLKDTPVEDLTLDGRPSHFWVDRSVQGIKVNSGCHQVLTDSRNNETSGDRGVPDLVTDRVPLWHHIFIDDSILYRIDKSWVCVDCDFM